MSTPSEAYQFVLRHILRHGHPVQPRGLLCLEDTDFQFRVDDPSPEPIITRNTKRNERIARYTRDEFDLYNSGTNLARHFATHAKIWAQIQNPDGTVNSAYGHLIHDPSCGKTKFAKHGPISPWDWAKCSLMQDEDTRQAFLRFSLPKHQWFGNRDQVCTMHGWFAIRNNALNFTIVMRSNDVVKGLVYDMPWFCFLMEKMRLDLVSHYPTLRLGSYTHFAHSMHIYATDFKLAHSMIGESYEAADIGTTGGGIPDLARTELPDAGPEPVVAETD